MARDRRPLRSICLNLKEGNNLDELRSAYASKADAVTHELEDHCPARFKDVARKNIRQVIDDQGPETPTFVRTTTAVGRTPSRERVCTYVVNSVVAGSFKKNQY